MFSLKISKSLKNNNNKTNQDETWESRAVDRRLRRSSPEGLPALKVGAHQQALLMKQLGGRWKGHVSKDEPTGNGSCRIYYLLTSQEDGNCGDGGCGIHDCWGGGVRVKHDEMLQIT